MTSYSVIVPVYNEAETLRPLCERLQKVLAGSDFRTHLAAFIQGISGQLYY